MYVASAERIRRARALAALGSCVCVLAVGCGDDTPAGMAPDARVALDGGPSAVDSGSSADAALVHPAPPVLPDLTPCPPGWREVASPNPDDLPSCDPWPGTGARADCAPGEAHFPGEPDCRVIGDPCPMGDFPEGLPAGAMVVWTRSGATGGDGTSAAPFGTIAAALAATPAGGIVALAKGTFSESVTPTRDVTLWGACAAETRIEGAGMPVSVTSTGVSLVLRNLTLGPGVLRVHAVGGSLSGRGIVARGLSINAFDFDSGATGTLDDISVLPSLAASVLAVAGDSNVTVSRLAVTGEPSTLFVVDGSVLVISDFSLLAAAVGPGSVSVTGASLTLERGVFGPAAGMTIEANGAVSVTMRDVVFDGPPGGPTHEDGLLGPTGATLTLERVSFDDVRGVAVLAGLGTLDATDVVIRRVGPNALGIARGFALHEGTRATLRRVLVERAQEIGVIVDGAGAMATFEDAWIRDTESRASDGTFGRGLQVQEGARVEATRIRLERNRELSAFVTSPGSELTLRDVVATATQRRACSMTTCIAAGAGIGIASYNGAHADLERFESTDNLLVGLQIARDGTMDARVGFVVRNPIGLNLQVPGYDVMRVSDRVIYMANETNLDTAELPLPTAIAAL